jgi:hypothetical protein
MLNLGNHLKFNKNIHLLLISLGGNLLPFIRTFIAILFFGCSEHFSIVDVEGYDLSAAVSTDQLSNAELEKRGIGATYWKEASEIFVGTRSSYSLFINRLKASGYDSDLTARINGEPSGFAKDVTGASISFVANPFGFTLFPGRRYTAPFPFYVPWIPITGEIGASGSLGHLTMTNKPEYAVYEDNFGSELYWDLDVHISIGTMIRIYKYEIGAKIAVPYIKFVNSKRIQGGLEALFYVGTFEIVGERPKEESFFTLP